MRVCVTVYVYEEYMNAHLQIETNGDQSIFAEVVFKEQIKHLQWFKINTNYINR